MHLVCFDVIKQIFSNKYISNSYDLGTVFQRADLELSHLVNYWQTRKSDITQLPNIPMPVHRHADCCATFNLLFIT